MATPVPPPSGLLRAIERAGRPVGAAARGPSRPAPPRPNAPPVVPAGPPTVGAAHAPVARAQGRAPASAAMSLLQQQHAQRGTASISPWTVFGAVLLSVLSLYGLARLAVDLGAVCPGQFSMTTVPGPNDGCRATLPKGSPR